MYRIKCTLRSTWVLDIFFAESQWNFHTLSKCIRWRSFLFFVICCKVFTNFFFLLIMGKEWNKQSPKYFWSESNGSYAIRLLYFFSIENDYRSSPCSFSTTESVHPLHLYIPHVHHVRVQQTRTVFFNLSSLSSYLRLFLHTHVMCAW